MPVEAGRSWSRSVVGCGDHHAARAGSAPRCAPSSRSGGGACRARRALDRHRSWTSGSPCAVPASTARAAAIASIGSDLPCAVGAAGSGRSTSTTVTSWLGQVPGQPGPVGAGALDPDHAASPVRCASHANAWALPRPVAGTDVAGRAGGPDSSSSAARVWVSAWVSTPPTTDVRRTYHGDAPAFLVLDLEQARTAGRADSTVTRPGQAPIRSRVRPAGACAPATTDQPQGAKPVDNRVSRRDFHRG